MKYAKMLDEVYQNVGWSIPKCWMKYAKIVDNFPNLETRTFKDIKMLLFYVAGNLMQKDCSRDEEISNKTEFIVFVEFFKQIKFRLGITVFQHSLPSRPDTSSTSIAMLGSHYSKMLSTADMMSSYELFSQ